MFNITKKNYKDLLTGSLFLATGGGLDYDTNKKIIKSITFKSSIPIKDKNEFNDNDYFASIYGVGDPSKLEGINKKLIINTLKKYEALTKIKIKAIIPGEIGAESLAMQAANILNLPTLDSDLVGGRAAPEIQLDCFTIYNLPLTPLFAANTNGDSIFIQKNLKAKQIENKIRPFFAKNSGSGVLIGYPIKARLYKKYGFDKSISLALKIGELLNKKSLAKFLKSINGRVVAEGKIKNANLKSLNGFYVGSYEVNNYKIEVKNENISLYKKSRKISKAPNLIMILNKNLKPIHNTKIKNKQEVKIITAPAMSYWKNKTNKKLWEV